MGRRFKVDRLGPEAEDLLRSGMRAGWTLDEMQRELREVCGEKVSTSAIHRWVTQEHALEGLLEKSARAQFYAEGLMGVAAADSSGDVARGILAILQGEVMRAAAELGDDLDLAQLQQLFAAQKKLELAEGKLDIERQRLAIEERNAESRYLASEAAMKAAEARTKALELQAAKAKHEAEQAERALDEAARGGRDLTVAEMARIREQVFGIRQQLEGDAA